MGLDAVLLDGLISGGAGAPAPTGIDWATVGRMAQLTARAKTVDEVLERAIDCLTTACGAPAATVWLYDDERERLALVTERGLDPDDGGHESRDWAGLFKLPLNSGGEIIGVLELYTDDPEGFHGDQRNAFNLVGAHLATALHRTRLAAEQPSAGSPSDAEKLEEMEARVKLWLATSHAHSYPHLFESLLNCLGEAVPCDAAALLLVNGAAPQCLVALERHGHAAHVQAVADRAEAAFAAFGGLPELVSDPSVRLIAEAAGPGVDRPLHAGFGVPLLQGEELVGVLYVAAVDEDAFTEREIRILYGYAAHASDSMQRVRELNQEEVERLETIIASLPQGVVLLDAEGHVLLHNENGRQRLELIGADGPTVALLHGLPLAELVQEAIVSGTELAQRELELRRADVTHHFVVTVVPVQDEGEIVGTVLSIEDVSEQRQTEQRLLHDARLASIGEFASGLAHELNNPMMIILGLVEMLQDDEAMTLDRDQLLGDIKEAALRAADIVKQVIEFADTQRGGWDNLHLQDVLEQAIGLVVTKCRSEGVEVDLQWDPDLPLVKGNPGKLQQVVLALLNNAHDAIVLAGQGGRIVIRTRATAGEVLVEVEDDGPGIPPEQRDKVFDVFYTTKRDYHGKGLGLPLAHRIAHEHSGSLTVTESPAGGALFRLSLPKSTWTEGR